MGLNGKEFSQLVTSFAHSAYINLSGVGPVVPLRNILEMLTKYVDGNARITMHPDGRIDYAVSAGEGEQTGAAEPQSHAPAKVLSLVQPDEKAAVQETPHPEALIPEGMSFEEAGMLPVSAFPATGRLCSVCRGPQYRTPSGDSCDQGHGGASPIEPGDS